VQGGGGFRRRKERKGSLIGDVCTVENLTTERWIVRSGKRPDRSGQQEQKSRKPKGKMRREKSGSIRER
jgi:hypothetical protein